MAKKVLTIEINNDKIIVCEAAYAKAKTYIYKSATMETPEDSYFDGSIKLMRSISDAIETIKRNENIKTNKVRFTINSTKIASREVTIPYVKEDKILNIVTANISEYFPINVEEFLFSYTVMEKVKREKKSKAKPEGVEGYIKLLVFAVPASIMENYYNLASKMKLEIVSIDYVGNSIFQVLKKQQQNETNLYIQIDRSSSLITVTSKQNLLLQRNIPNGIESVISAVINERIFDANTMDQAYSLLKDEEILVLPQKTEDMAEAAATLDFMAELSQEELSVRAKEKAKENVGDAFLFLMEKIVRIVDYYASKNQNSKIENVYLVGEVTKLKGVEKILSTEFGLTVKYFYKLQDINLSRSLKKKQIDIAEILSGIGAGILPVEFRAVQKVMEKKARSEKRSLVFVSILVLISSIALVATSYLFYYQAKTERDAAAQRLTEVDRSVDEVVKELQLEQTRLDQIKGFGDQTISNNERLVDFLRDLEKLAPSDMKFLNLSCADGIVELQGVATSKESVAKLIVNLKTLNYVWGINVPSLSESVDENGVANVIFPISCNLIYTNTEEIEPKEAQDEQ